MTRLDREAQRRRDRRDETRAEWADLPATRQQQRYVQLLLDGGARADPPAQPVTRGGASAYIDRLKAARNAT